MLKVIEQVKQDLAECRRLACIQCLSVRTLCQCLQRLLIVSRLNRRYQRMIKLCLPVLPIGDPDRRDNQDEQEKQGDTDCALPSVHTYSLPVVDRSSCSCDVSCPTC